jgi:two-component system response regulator HydG
MDHIEREAIRITLQAAGGNQSRTARMLGISRATLLRKLEKYRLGTREDSADIGAA